MEFNEKNTTHFFKLAKLETDLKREKSETEKLRAEIAALKTSIEKSDANMDPNSDKLSAEIAVLKTRKKQLIAELEPNSDSKGYGTRGKKKNPTTKPSIIRRPKVSKTLTPARTTKKPLKFAYRLLGQ